MQINYLILPVLLALTYNVIGNAIIVDLNSNIHNTTNVNYTIYSNSKNDTILNRPIIVPGEEPGAPNNITTILRFTPIINNRNKVNKTTNIRSRNKNTILIKLSNQGGYHTVVVRNETKTEVFTESTPIDEPLEYDTIKRKKSVKRNATPDSNEKCCDVITPRDCKKTDEEWECVHRVYRRCGPFCTKPKLYLTSSGDIGIDGTNFTPILDRSQTVVQSLPYQSYGQYPQMQYSQMQYPQIQYPQMQYPQTQEHLPLGFSQHLYPQFGYR